MCQVFLDKYNPDQFEILGSDYNIKEGLLPELVNMKWKGKLDRGYVNNKRLYTRIFIKHRKNNMNTTLKPASLFKKFATGLSITNLKARGLLACLASYYSARVSAKLYLCV